MSAYDGPFAGLAAASNQLADCFLLTDRQGQILHVNPAFEQATGYSREEVLGKTPRLLKSGVHPREVYEELWRTICEGRHFRFIFTNRKKSGELYEEGVIISPLRDESGAVTHFASVGRVIDQFRQTYDVFTLLADSSPIAMYVLRDGRFFHLNRSLLLLTGYAADELIERPWSVIVHEEDRELAESGSAAMLSMPAPSPVEFRVLDKAGNVHWVLQTWRPAQFRGLAAVSGTFVVASFVDITARKVAEQEVKRALSMYRATIESTTDGIVITDMQGAVAGYNRRYVDMWRLPFSVLTGMQARELFDLKLRRVEDRDALQSLLESALDRPDVELNGTVTLEDGSIFEVYSKPQLIEDEPAGRVWSFRDVTEPARLQATLQHLASHDSLTGVPNRRAFHEALERELATASPDTRLAVLFIDVDSFKDMNDSLGHAAGDRYLKALSAALRDAIAPPHLLARLGGDEFGVLLRGADRIEALAEAQRLLEAARRPARLPNGENVCFTLSIGCALFPVDGLTLDELLSCADSAMYLAKQAGGNKVRLFSATEDTAQETEQAAGGIPSSSAAA